MSPEHNVMPIENVRLTDDGRGVVILDQTRLPNRTEFRTLYTPEEMFEAIQKLRVRGRRPSAYARLLMSALARQWKGEDYSALPVVWPAKDYRTSAHSG